MSQKAANEVVRVLSGTRLKYTCTVHKPDGSKLEWQSDNRASVCWHDNTRRMWVVETASYESQTVLEWQEGMVLLVEENPEAPK